VTDGAPDLKAQIDKGSARKLVFTDYLTASELAHWLKIQLAGTRAKPRLSKMKLTFDVEANRFKHVVDDCKSTPQLTASR